MSSQKSRKSRISHASEGGRSGDIGDEKKSFESVFWQPPLRQVGSQLTLRRQFALGSSTGEGRLCVLLSALIARTDIEFCLHAISV